MKIHLEIVVMWIQLVEFIILIFFHLVVSFDETL